MRHLLIIVFSLSALFVHIGTKTPDMYQYIIESTQAGSYQGAYQMETKQGNAEVRAVKIVTGKYFTVAYYDQAGKKFAGTEGGTYASDNGSITETIEFSTLDSTQVGSSHTLQSSFKGNKWTVTGMRNGKQVKETWEKIPEPAAGSTLAGAWRITQRLDPSTNAMSTMQQGPRKTIKMMSGSRFQWIAYNTATKQFGGTGGGTYQVKDGKYTETIEFFPRDPSRIGMQLTFDVNVKGKDWHHTGKSTTGKPVNEVWTNVD